MSAPNSAFFSAGRLIVTSGVQMHVEAAELAAGALRARGSGRGRRAMRTCARHARRTGSDVDASNLIIFEVNGWHNLVHIASGLVGLAPWRNPAAARSSALGFGAVYLLISLAGIAAGLASTAREP